MITLFELRLELLAMLIAPLMAPGLVWLVKSAFAGRRTKRAVARAAGAPARLNG
jgi:hypothetical protein